MDHLYWNSSPNPGIPAHFSVTRKFCPGQYQSIKKFKKKLATSNNMSSKVWGKYQQHIKNKAEERMYESLSAFVNITRMPVGKKKGGVQDADRELKKKKGENKQKKQGQLVTDAGRISRLGQQWSD
jgi:hypothetical protein